MAWMGGAKTVRLIRRYGNHTQKLWFEIRLYGWRSELRFWNFNHTEKCHVKNYDIIHLIHWRHWNLNVWHSNCNPNFLHFAQANKMQTQMHPHKRRKENKDLPLTRLHLSILHGWGTNRSIGAATVLGRGFLASACSHALCSLCPKHNLKENNVKSFLSTLDYHYGRKKYVQQNTMMISQKNNSQLQNS